MKCCHTAQKTGNVPILYQFQHKIYACTTPTKNESWTHYKDLTGLKVFKVRNRMSRLVLKGSEIPKYLDQAGMFKSPYQTNIG
jgi:uncharacterized protein YfaP (DUF2135 family)